MSTQKTITAAGIEAVLIRKRVKNVRVTVLPPDGTVRVTAPTLYPEALIRAFLTEKADWIRTHRDAVRARHADEPKRFESGETVTVFGAVYTLAVLPHAKKNAAEPDGSRIVISIKGDASPERCRKILDEWFRARLKTEIEYLLPLWSEKTGLVPGGWTVRSMTSRWGSCNTQTGRITLNLQLIAYPIPCLEYVILHELAHLRVRGHGADFKAILDAYMPSWRERRKRLNG